ncbi:MAG: glycosyltransferase [Methylacidiphilales bacterium]|nr:glycosyltransferase [Candidatus Methylacidiphilales bacterium]
MPDFSVIICSRNPRPDYLQRALDALQAQTLPRERWELLLVDNASKEPLVSAWNLSWHPRSRHIREEEPGIVPARLRSIGESTAELLVFVDDDTVLAPNYLSAGQKIAESHSSLGVWSGQCHPEFEITPPLWVARFGSCLTIRRFSGECWSNLGLMAEHALPWGAGMWVRRKVALEYKARVGEDSSRKKLGEFGGVPRPCEDFDLAQTACDIGLGAGIFSTLELTHLIGKNRLTESYLLGATEGTAYSMIMLKASRGMAIPPRTSRLRRALGRLRRWLTLSPVERLVVEARIRGEQRALDELADR